MKKINENPQFDILFLCHEKDIDSLKYALKYAKKNVVGYRKIFLLSKENFFPNNKDLTFVNENIFPFSKEDMKKYVSQKRAGWYYQQFLKLYFLKVMKKKVLDNILIIDADTIFLKKTKFFQKGKALYNFEIGYHQPYYSVMQKVFGFSRQKENLSGITHHIIFQRKYLDKIFEIGSKKGKVELWKNVLNNVDPETISGFSEYDLYFNYMLKNHSKEISLRKLKFIDFPYFSKKWINFFTKLNYNYLSAHEYLRKEKFPIIKSLTLETLKLLGLRIFIKNSLIKLGLRKRK